MDKSASTSSSAYPETPGPEPGIPFRPAYWNSVWLSGASRIGCAPRAASRAGPTSGITFGGSRIPPANISAELQRGRPQFQQMAGAGFVKLRMISAEMALRCIFTERGLTAPRRLAPRRGISYYPRYETQTYSLTAIGLRLEQQVVVGRCILFFQGPARVPTRHMSNTTHGSCSSHMVRVGGFQQMAGAGFVKLRMISAEMALRCIFTERGLTAPRRLAPRRGISYYPRYETQTYSLTAIGLRLEQQVVVGRCILFFQGPARVPSSSVGRCLHVKALQL